MKTNLHHIVFLLSTLILSVLFTEPAIAQRGKKKGQSKEARLREAEFYFTEGEKYFILEDYAKALVLFEKSLSINPSNATVYFKKAQIHAQAEELTKALTAVNTALEFEQDNKYFYALASDIYTQMGNFKKASEQLEEMIGRIDGTDPYLFELAALYLYQNRYDDALQAYTRIENTYGISEEIIAQKQKIYLQLNDLDNALAEVQKLLDAYPGEEKYVLQYAELLLSNDLTDKAITFLQDFLQENESPQARLVLADLLKNKGDLEASLRNLELAFKNPALSAENKVQLLAEYRQQLPPDELADLSLKLSKVLVETHPDAPEVYAIYGDILYALNRKKEAKTQYVNALEHDGSNFSIWQNIVQIAMEVHQLDSAVYYADKALELFPNQAALYYFSGAANLQLTNYDEAILMLEQGKRLTGANEGLKSAFSSALGDAYYGIKNYNKSDAAYEEALEFDSENYGVLNNYAYYLALRKEKLEKAENMSAKTVKANPGNPTFLDTYAWVLYMRGKYKEAKKVMEKAIATGNVSAIHYEHYGDILYKLGNIDEAVKQWQKAKGLNPNAELIDKKISDRKLYEN